MFKNTLVIGFLAFALSMTGCAAIQGFAGDYIPTVEAKLGAAGIAVTIDPKLGVDAFCLDPIGTIASFISKIPIIGAATADFVGLCEQDEETVE